MGDSMVVEERELEDGTKEYKCPNCGEWVPHFVWFSNATAPMCPKCNKFVPRDQVPPEAIVWQESKRETKKRASRRRKKKEEEEESPEIREKELKKIEMELGAEEEEEYGGEEGLFETPKPPERVLWEILSQYKHIRSEFIRAMVRRSKIKGGLTPDELKYFLLNMKSGVKSEAEASFIADEYAWALRNEAEKAQKTGYPMSYPLPNYMAPKSGGFVSSMGFGSRTSSYSPPYSPPVPSTISRYQPPSTTGDIDAKLEALRQEFQSTIQQLFQEKERKKLEERLHEMEIKSREQYRDILEMIKEMQRQFQEAMKEMYNQFMQGLQQLSQQAQNPPPNVVTREELEKLQLQQLNQMLQQQLEFWKKLDEEKSKQIMELIKELKTWKEKSEKDKLELLKKIEELSRREPYKPEGYKSDEIRLLAEGVHTLADVAKEKRPIEIVVKTLPMLMSQQPTPQQPRYQEVPSESKSNVIELLGGTEYVAEE